ncbi:hypothetical protein B0H14DRAFT_3449486 [Mycena olivaceomarginata]|nr:hypothetical protein B0H14DRAFT_3449486 [Mycena olivaceomarginata]
MLQVTLHVMLESLLGPRTLLNNIGNKVILTHTHFLKLEADIVILDAQWCFEMLCRGAAQCTPVQPVIDGILRVQPVERPAAAALNESHTSYQAERGSQLEYITEDNVYKYLAHLWYPPPEWLATTGPLIDLEKLLSESLRRHLLYITLLDKPLCTALFDGKRMKIFAGPMEHQYGKDIFVRGAPRIYHPCPVPSPPGVCGKIPGGWTARTYIGDGVHQFVQGMAAYHTLWAKDATTYSIPVPSGLGKTRMGLEYLETVQESTSACETHMTHVLLSLAGPPVTLPSLHFLNTLTPIDTTTPPLSPPLQDPRYSLWTLGPVPDKN